MKIGIIREGKIPHDKRVAFTPEQCKELSTRFPDTEVIVQPSEHRCISDDDYKAAGITISEDLSLSSIHILRVRRTYALWLRLSRDAVK